MPVTMRDIADKVGVSIRTVSRVVNHKGEISEETRRRVQTAIDELGYRPNALARGLVSGKTLSVAVIIRQITDPFFPEFVQGVESVARSHGYGVFLCNTDEDPQQELEYVETLAAKQVDGIILCGTGLNTEQLSHVAAVHKVAIVTSRAPQSAAVVSIPGEAGLFETTSHLIRLGHRDIGYLGSQKEDRGERSNGYRRALRNNGIEVEEHKIIFARTASIETGQQAARQLFEQAPQVTAISCYNDLMAIGALQACAEAGRRVPEDVAVVGFDDVPLASLVTPALTTVHVPRHELGELVMQLLLRVMAADDKCEERLLIQTRLIVRESCGASKKSSRPGIEPG